MSATKAGTTSSRQASLWGGQRLSPQFLSRLFTLGVPGRQSKFLVLSGHWAAHTVPGAKCEEGRSVHGPDGSLAVKPGLMAKASS